MNPARKRKASASPSGSSIGRRGQKKLPTPRRLCTCSPCKANPDMVPDEPKTSAEGRFLEEDEWAEHDKLEKKRLIAAAHLQRDTPALPSEITQTSTPPSPVNVQAESSVAPNVPYTTDLTRQKVIKKLMTVSNGIKCARAMVQANPVFFKIPPQKLSRAPMAPFNPDLYTLDPHAELNAPILSYKSSLSEAKTLAQYHLQSHHASVKKLSSELLCRCEEEEDKLREELLSVRKRQQTQLGMENAYDTVREYCNAASRIHPLTLACFLIVAVMHLLSGTSMTQCAFLLGSFCFIIDLVLTLSNTTFPVPNILRSIPRDIRTVLDRLNVAPDKTAYVCCPKCCKLYWIDPASRYSYPERCTNNVLGYGQCAAKLRRKRRARDGGRPVRKYHMQNIRSYLSSIYARSDLAPHLQKKPMTSTKPVSMMRDIFDGSGLSEILTHDGKPFIIETQDQNEGRLVFSLNMDAFNPFGNREAGKKVSVAAMYMVCLNLPPSIRYDLDNMFLVGVIPGPHEPSLHEINQFLGPLVKELLQLWRHGVYLTRTWSCPHGQLVRCALGPLVCDLPAARQMSGFSHFLSTHFCSECKQTLEHRNNLDYKTWKPRCSQEHLELASRWKNATTSQERDKILNDHGVRWSELLALPYWNPIKMTVIDPMHCFYLRLLQRHIRDIWGMDVSFDDGDGITFDKAPTEAEMETASNVLRYQSRSKLNDLPVRTLRQLCADLSLPAARAKKKVVLDSLIAYRIERNWFDKDGYPVGNGGTTIPQREAIDLTGYPTNQHLQIQTMADLDDVFSNRGKTYINRLIKADLITIFRYKASSVPRPSYSACVSHSADYLREKIMQKRHEMGIVDKDGKLKSDKKKKTRVLGREVLKDIRHDMEHTTRPTWSSPPPAHPGEKQWGKLTADQWRTLCIEVLPITLTRLWGDEPESSRNRQCLDNFMDLISAVKIANSRTITTAQIDQYEFYIHRYLSGLLKLYNVTNITPYQHLSLHFGDLLRRFGPTHSWRCFAFERYNYVMRQIPTNQKFGELETTLFHKFCEAQKLRSLLKPSTIPTTLHPFLALFDKFFGPGKHRDSWTNIPHDDSFNVLEEEDTWSAEEATSLSAANTRLLNNWLDNYTDGMTGNPQHVVSRNAIYRLGMRFAVHDISEADSQIIYRTPGSNGRMFASIQEMFTHTAKTPDNRVKTQTFAVVNNYMKIDQGTTDAYLRYPIVGAQMVLHKLQTIPVLVSMDDIECHFLSCQFDGPTELGIDYLVCLALDK